MRYYDDFDYDDLSSDEIEELRAKAKEEFEEEQYNSPISMYSLGLTDRDFM